MAGQPVEVGQGRRPDRHAGRVAGAVRAEAGHGAPPFGRRPADAGQDGGEQPGADQDERRDDDEEPDVDDVGEPGQRDADQEHARRGGPQNALEDPAAELARRVPLEDHPRAIDAGALKKPESVTRMIATDDRRGDAVQDARRCPIAISRRRRSSVPSRQPVGDLAIIRLPTTKPTDVTPSWRPYSNSVAWRALSANGRSRTFHRPNDRKTGAPEMKSERRIGRSDERRDALLEVLDDDA